MYQYKAAMIEVETCKIEKTLIGAQLICEGIYDGLLERSLDGILNLDKSLTREENAYEFLSDNYSTLQGAFLAIGSTLAMINTAIANTDIIISPGNRLQMKPYAEQGEPSK